VQDVLAAEDEFWSRVKVPDEPPRTVAECIAALRQLSQIALVHRLQVLTQVYRGEWRIRRCGARTKQPDHHACRNIPEPGRTRCKWHGGMSTGPRTVEGRDRIAEAQRRRWAEWRGEVSYQ